MLLLVVSLSMAAPPTAVTDAREVAAGQGEMSHSGCYRTAEGRVACWGGSNVGHDFVGPQPGPWDVPLSRPALSVTTVAEGHCAVLDDGTVECWRGHAGKATPEAVAVDHVVALAAGASHQCALRDDGSVWCWGSDLNGALGIGAMDPTRRDPAPVPGVDHAVAVAAGGYATCTLRDDGAAWCWGHHPFTGATRTTEDVARTSAPREIPELRGARRMAMGYDTVCIERADEALACVVRDRVPVLTRIEPAVRAPRALSASTRSMCAVVEGAVWCWGEGPVAPMSGARPSRPYERAWKVKGLDDAVAVSASLTHACAVTAAGHVRCWGYNAVGQLGDGTTEDHPRDASYVVHHAPDALPEPRGGVHGCTATYDLRRSCRQMGPECRLTAPPGYWWVQPSGAELTEDDERRYAEVLGRRGVPGCACDCTEQFRREQQAFDAAHDENPP